MTEYAWAKIKIDKRNFYTNFNGNGIELIEYFKRLMVNSGVDVSLMDEYMKDMKTNQYFMLVASDNPIEIIQQGDFVELDNHEFIEDKEMEI